MGRKRLVEVDAETEQREVVKINAEEAPKQRVSCKVTAILDPRLREQLRRIVATQKYAKYAKAGELASAILTRWIEEEIREHGGEFAKPTRSAPQRRIDLASISQAFTACKEPFLPFNEAVTQLEIKATTLRSCIRAGCPIKTFGNGKGRIFFIPADVVAWIRTQSV